MEKRKNKIRMIECIVFGIFLFIVLMAFVIGYTSNNPDVEYSSNSETICEGSVCQATIYSYEKYWFDSQGGKWEEIDKNFGTRNCILEYDYCVDKNLYQVYLEESSGEIRVVRDEEEFLFRPGSLWFRNERGDEKLINNFRGKGLVVKDNTVEYRDAYGKGIHLRFTYFPTELKQELVISKRRALPSPEIEGEVSLDLDQFVLEKEDSAFLISPPVAFDGNGEFLALDYSFEEFGERILSLRTPYKWLVGDEIRDPKTEEIDFVKRKYPVVIDPTITLADSETNWNGVVSWKSKCFVSSDIAPRGSISDICQTNSYYVRANNPSPFIDIGKTNIYSLVRGGIDWDISTIPSNTLLLGVNLSLFIESADLSGVLMNITHMGGNSSNYPDGEASYCGGNCNFYFDMGNGSVYDSTVYPGGNNYVINIGLDSGARNDLQNALLSNVKSFSMGLSPDLGKNIKISSRDNPNLLRRPRLIVNYNIAFANETQGDEATKQGILNAISQPEIHDEQQVYEVLADGTQTISSFDKFTTYQGQSWAFNYITSGEGFTSMGNVSTSFFVSEMTNLTTIQITQEVEQFINSTLA